LVHHTGYKRITLLFALSDAILSVAAFKSFHLEADVLYKNMAGTRSDEYEVICNQLGITAKRELLEEEFNYKLNSSSFFLLHYNTCFR